MSLQDQLTADMKTAMKDKDSTRLNTIRMVRSALKNKEIEVGGALDDQGVIGVVSTLVKQRRDAAAVYRENDREDMAAQEEAEIAILQQYLPAQLSEAEIDAIVAAAVAEAGATSLKEMGAVMKIVMAKTAGRADGKLVNQKVREQLGA